jgi:hypothetical protein
MPLTFSHANLHNPPLLQSHLHGAPKQVLEWLLFIESVFVSALIFFPNDMNIKKLSSLSVYKITQAKQAGEVDSQMRVFFHYFLTS